LTKAAQKGYQQAPKAVQDKVDFWVEAVLNHGLTVANKSRPGLKPHPLSGHRRGQFAIRLSGQWRLIYEVHETGVVTVFILEVTPHDYRTR
jgi:plasmid maintenance system killer protein